MLLIGMMLADVIHFGWLGFFPSSDNVFLDVFIDAAVREESTKWLPAILVSWAGLHPYFTVLIGAGFGIEEMWMHYWYDDWLQWSDIAGHTLTMLVMAEYLRLAFAHKASKLPHSRAKFYKLLILSLVVPITLHGAHNFLLDVSYLLFIGR